MGDEPGATIVLGPTFAETIAMTEIKFLTAALESEMAPARSTFRLPRSRQLSWASAGPALLGVVFFAPLAMAQEPEAPEPAAETAATTAEKPALQAATPAQNTSSPDDTQPQQPALEPAQEAASVEPRVTKPAQRTTGESETRGSIDLSVPEAPPPPARTAYVHEGLYVRLAAGPGFFRVGLSDKDTDTTQDANAGSLAGKLLVGGSPSPGMTFGAGLLGQLAPNAKFGPSNKQTVLNYTVGAFFDAFPDNEAGFHLGGLLGLSGLSPGKDADALLGVGGAAWAGYDFWVTPEWSSGLELQVGGSAVGNNEGSGGAFHTNLLLTLLYN